MQVSDALVFLEFLSCDIFLSATFYYQPRVLYQSKKKGKKKEKIRQVGVICVQE